MRKVLIRGEVEKVSITLEDLKKILSFYGFTSGIDHFILTVDTKKIPPEQINKLNIPAKDIFQDIKTAEKIEVIKIGSQNTENHSVFRSGESTPDSPSYHIEATFRREKDKIDKRLFRIEFRDSVRKYLINNPEAILEEFTKDNDLIIKFSTKLPRFLSELVTGGDNYSSFKPLLTKVWSSLSADFITRLNKILEGKGVQTK